MVGRQLLSVKIRGPIETDWTQGTPPQSWPAGIAFAWVHSPAHPAGGSKDCEMFLASVQLVELVAVIFAGSAQPPVGGLRSQVTHDAGKDISSALPSLEGVGAQLGHCG